MKVEIRNDRYPIQTFEHVSKVVFIVGHDVEIHHAGTIDEVQFFKNERLIITGNQSIEMNLCILGKLPKVVTDESKLWPDILSWFNTSQELETQYIVIGDSVTIMDETS